MIAPYTYETNIGQIFAWKNHSDIVMLMDYRCSLMYVKFYYIDLFKLSNEIAMLDYNGVVIVSIISLLLVIIFYLIIKGLRNNIIGKSTLMLVIINCCFYINYRIGMRSENLFVYFLKNYLPQLNDPWLFFIVWDTFRFMRYVLCKQAECNKANSTSFRTVSNSGKHTCTWAIVPSRPINEIHRPSQ